MVPHLLPTSVQLLSAIKHLPLQLTSYSDESEFYLALLTRVRHTLLKQPVYAYGTVGRGYGRGGKKLGVPTANLKPDGDGPLRQGDFNYTYYSNTFFSYTSCELLLSCVHPLLQLAWSVNVVYAWIALMAPYYVLNLVQLACTYSRTTIVYVCSVDSCYMITSYKSCIQA
jgi:Riboflavin kinase